MNIRIILIIVLFSVNCFSQNDTLRLSGIFQGKNILRETPFTEDGHFCIVKERVNGVDISRQAHLEPEIDLMPLRLKMGDSVRIEIIHRKGCLPKIINEYVLRPASTFSITHFECKGGLLKWITKGESGSIPFIIEQSLCNKWTKIGEVQGAGSPGPVEYSFDVVLHSGENRFRICQVGFSGVPRFSDTLKVQSTLKANNFRYDSKKSEIDLDYPAIFEIRDVYSNLVKKGFSQKVDVSNLPRGDYYLCFDNRVEVFKK